MHPPPPHNKLHFLSFNMITKSNLSNIFRYIFYMEMKFIEWKERVDELIRRLICAVTLKKEEGTII
jgi:hypothetical protein